MTNLKVILCCMAWCVVPVLFLTPFVSFLTSIYVFILVVLIQLVSFKYLEKVFIWFLRAREVKLPQDNFYQYLEYVSFKNGVSKPKVFLYKGRLKKFFVMKNKGGWIFLCEEELYLDIKRGEHENFAEDIVQAYQSKSFTVQGKALGGLTLYHLVAWLIIRKACWLEKKNRISIALFCVFSFLSYPIIAVIELLVRKKIKMRVPLNIADTINVKDQMINYRTFVLSHAVTGVDIEEVFRHFLLGLLEVKYNEQA